MVSAIDLAILIFLTAIFALLIALLVIARRKTGSDMSLVIKDLLAVTEKSQGETLRLETRGIRDELQSAMALTRKELADRLDVYGRNLQENSDRIARVLQENRKETVDTLQVRLEGVQKTMVEASEKQVVTMNQLREKVTESVVTSLKEIQDKNEQKLEQMRLTVDEKLQKTLDTRITQSFELVTKQLLEVQKGLTEMQSLAQDVGGLKKALTNVKVRGMLGEAQLGALLEQFLTREQYGQNVVITPKSKENVEFAVKLPGMETGECVWLPIDSKFPIEDYQRLQDAYESGDKPAWEAAGKAFENRLFKHAADISSKYIDVPHSTDFALMFLPFESLYGEAIRRPGLFQEIQGKYRITIVGPTTLAAFLNSLQVGFKTLAISKQSGEVWKVLGAIKTEFQKFGEAVSKVQKNLEAASNNLASVSDRARQMEKKLGKVSALPSEEALRLLPAGDDGEPAADEDAPAPVGDDAETGNPP